ncbi:conserved hypothetical protein [Coccidioides posadasii str. Silveira]|uniref:Uncharacterized protein n=2 Tax=Coccidioides posadasii TaxID=199306 RepID=E9DI16_COCPS|nr:conserved hypothetical protein [Coccidioides posadasii str. Silveira]KMM67846.1 hypothetical protein CPAG_04179 [Coccidioides posadasii RMSCC 3488]
MAFAVWSSRLVPKRLPTAVKPVPLLRNIREVHGEYSDGLLHSLAADFCTGILLLTAVKEVHQRRKLSPLGLETGAGRDIFCLDPQKLEIYINLHGLCLIGNPASRLCPGIESPRIIHTHRRKFHVRGLHGRGWVDGMAGAAAPGGVISSETPPARPARRLSARIAALFLETHC